MLRSFSHHLFGGACEECQMFLVLDENLPSYSKSMNFGSVLLFIRIFQINYEQLLDSYCYLSSRARKAFEEYKTVKERIPSNIRLKNNQSQSAIPVTDTRFSRSWNPFKRKSMDLHFLGNILKIKQRQTDEVDPAYPYCKSPHVYIYRNLCKYVYRKLYGIPYSFLSQIEHVNWDQ